MRMRAFAIGFSAFFATTLPASAQTYPTSPITMIVPFAAGGPADVFARIVTPRMSEILGQQIVIENVGGAGGMTGSKRVADAAPDGYTFVVGTVGTHAQSQTMYKKPLYNSATDFTPVGLMADVPLVLIARKDLPANEFQGVRHLRQGEPSQDAVRLGRRRRGHPSRLRRAEHLHGHRHHPCALSRHRTRHAGPGGGRIDFLCEAVSTAKPQIDGGTIKALAMMTKERSPVLPNVPTTLEQGADLQAYTWYGIFLPKGTPDAVVAKLNAAAKEAMKTPALRTRLDELGVQVVSDDRMSPQYLGQFVKAEIEKWAAPIKASGVVVD